MCMCVCVCVCAYVYVCKSLIKRENGVQAEQDSRIPTNILVANSLSANLKVQVVSTPPLPPPPPKGTNGQIPVANSLSPAVKIY